MKSIFEEYEHRILKKYIRWRRVDEEDKEILDRFTAIGLVAVGFNFNKMYGTARLTKMGRGFLE